MQVKFSQKRDFQKQRPDKEQILYKILKSIRKHGMASMYQIVQEGMKSNSYDLADYLDLLTKCQAIARDDRIKGNQKIKCYYLTEKGVTLLSLLTNVLLLMPAVWKVNWDDN